MAKIRKSKRAPVSKRFVIAVYPATSGIDPEMLPISVP